MEPTASDPEVMQQYGMTVGIPNAGQVNALGMINIRGERSTTCKGDRDRHPSKGPLPAGSPKACEELRKMPDALERAAELDAKYGKAPDLAALPMYCVPFSFKDPFDTKDMRSTGGGDARYDIDFPARDHTLVAQLRAKGAIIYAKANTTEYNGRAGDPGGKHTPDKVLVVDARLPAQHLGRQPEQPLRHDPRRLARLELGLRGVGRRQPRHVQPVRGDAGVVPRPGQPQLGGAAAAAEGADVVPRRRHRLRHPQRPHRHPLPADRRLGQGARRAEGPGRRATTTRATSFTTIPRSAVLDGSYAAAAAQPGSKGSLKGMRIGIIRESMLTFPGIKADEPIVQAANAEIKQWLGDHLGATLVESSDPKFADDPAIENMTHLLHQGASPS